MTKTLFLAATLVTAAAAAPGYIDTYWVCYQPAVEPGSDPLVPDFNDGTYWTIDVVVTVYNDDDWTSTCATAELSGGYFFEHPLGGDTPPDEDLFDDYPALEWDSYYASTTGEAPYGFVPPVISERTYRAAVWFDVPPNGGDGTFLIARYTVKQTCLDTLAIWVLGSHTILDGGDNLWPFQGPGLVRPPPAWDLNGDYCVDQADLIILLAAFGSTADDPEWDCRADIDADYDVDQSDLGLLLAHWGEGCP